MDKRYNYGTRLSQIILNANRYSIRIGIEGQLSPKQNRLALLAMSEIFSRYFSIHYSRLYCSDQSSLREDSPRLQTPLIDTPLERLGYYLIMKRTDQSQTQQEFADKIGISRTHLLQIEKGRHKMNTATKMKIENVIQESIDDLLRLFDYEDPQVHCIKEQKFLAGLRPQVRLRPWRRHTNQQ